MKNNKRGGHHKIKQILAAIGLALMVVGICVPASVSGSERRVKGEWILPEHFPKGFDGYGYVNRITAEEVVIDDALLRISPSATYATRISVVASSGDFGEGDLVGYLTNSEQEIISLWLIKKGKP
ncbi:MAG: hypothetical protein JSW26_06750 [Desulfobacterales bacterium]|nr:MAG: hypothetical protein JSW26_06750 [Desulfobacterales bacterium]